MNQPADGIPERRGLAGVVMRLMRRFAPRRAEAAERESREWFIVCRKCGTARSYAELGWVRYGAYSRGKRLRHMCPTCGVKRWQSVERGRPRGPRSRREAAGPETPGVDTER